MKNDSQLAQELRAMTDAELSRSPQPDVDLVEAYVDAILELDGVEPETDEEVRRGIETVLKKNTQKHMRKHRRIRRALIAAIVAVLVAASSAAFMPLGTNDESMLHKWDFFLLHQKPGYSMDFGDYLTLVRGGKIETFKSIRQFVRITGANILVPTVLPEKNNLREVGVVFDYLFDCPSVHFDTGDPKIFVCVYIGYTHDDLESWEQAEQIGGHVCGIAAEDMWYQADFNYDGNGYTVSAHTYEDLLAVVDGLRDASKLYGKK